MSSGAWMMAVVVVLTLGTLGFLIASMVRSILVQRSTTRSVWKDFSLGLFLMILYFATWVGHAVSEWQVFTGEQLAQGRRPSAGDFVATFAQSTLENWQSEFLQLFTFVVLASLYIHKSSGESKDGDERIEASLRRIEESLGTLPAERPADEDGWQLPDSPNRVMS